MDVVLLAASGGLGSFLPIQDSFQSSKSVRFALSLSFTLFSLSIIEAAPSKCLVFLDHDEGVLSSKGNLTVMGAYAIVLWIFVIGIVVVLPGSIGGHVFQMAAARTKQDDVDDKKFPKRGTSPWCVRYCWQFTLLILFISYRVILAPLIHLGQRQAERFYHKEPILVMTNSHHDGSRHGTKKPVHANSNSSLASSKTAILGGVCGIGMALLILKTLGSLVIRLPTQETQILSILVSWLSAVGLLLSSTLNGFGSVSLPYTCLAGIFLEPIRPDILTKAELELGNTIQSMEAKVIELCSDSFNPSAMNDSSVTRRRTAVGKSAFTDFNSDESLRRKQVLQGEIEFLDTLIYELKEDILEMKYAQEQAISARTIWGKVRSYVGFLFSIVLLVRLYTAIMNVIQESIGPQPERGDPITTALLWLTGHHLVSTQDYNTLSQGVSLLLTALLSLSQIRTFLRTVAIVNRRVVMIYRKCCVQRSRPSEGHFDESSHHKIHSRVLAAVTGCYFLSCVVLTKMNLPLQYRSSFAGALGGMEYSIQTPVVNLVFCVSAGISAMVLSLLFGIQRQNLKRYADDEIVTLGATADAC